MRPNPQETADLVIFTVKILNGKLHFLSSENEKCIVQSATIHLALALPKSMQIYAWIIRTSISLRDNQKVMMRKNQ